MSTRICPVLAVLVLAAALPGTGGTQSVRDRSPWDALRRPLHLGMLAKSGRCPVSPSRPLDRGRLSAVGVGPVYPMPSGFSRYDRHPGLLGAKTIWIWRPALLTHATRVLVRGSRLDRPGVMRFQLGPQWDSAPLVSELHIDTSEPVGSFSNSKWGTTVTMLLVRARGCYGLQLDSAGGTSTIVVAA